MFADYGGDYKKYLEATGKKLPLLVVMVNNYDTLKDNFDTLTYGTIPDTTRDSERYGIIFVFTATATTSVRLNVTQNFKHFFTYKLKN